MLIAFKQVFQNRINAYVWMVLLATVINAIVKASQRSSLTLTFIEMDSIMT
jgi:hypothetical protein